ncbi:thiol reductant ABC exporter subunit CydC [Leifsonia sp. LS-T14]|uniref:thiol reductant ABC exporter subunit CydC n=1 Tax=unclassified Leifsonia TaxID=2663824 RepID=UPI0035A6C584
MDTGEPADAADRAEVRRILRLAIPPAGRLWAAIGFGVLGGSSAVALLGVSAWLITRASEQPALMYLSMAIVGVRAFALGRALFRYLERLAGHDAAFRQLGTVRARLYARLEPLAPDGLRGVRSGDLLSRLADDVDELQDLALRVLQPLVSAGIVVVASVIAVTVIQPAAGGVLLGALVAALVAGIVANRWASGTAERRVAPLRGELNDALHDLIGNVDVLTAYGALPAAQERVRRASERLTAAVRSRAAGLGVTAGVVTLVAGAATVAGLLVSIPALDAGTIDGPGLAVIALLPLAVFEVFGAVPPAFGALRRVHASAERIASAVPSRVPDGIPVDAADAASVVRSDVPEVRLEGVSAHWPGETSPVISGVTLRLHPGERVLLTGPTGAGKTALAHVLTRLLDHAGEYRLDGVPTCSLRQDDVRRVVGLIEQRPFLFDSDLRQNLLFARDTATDDELLAVLERVGLRDWAAARGGLSAPVGERGALVSGGQAQRIALARALLAGFPVLVVDEPTANLDAAIGNAVVRDVLQTAAEDGRTVLLISHTDVPPGLVDRELRLEGGRLLP